MNILLTAVLLAALDFSGVDAAFHKGADYVSCRTSLEQMLPKANDDKEKSLVLWRLSRVQVMIGESFGKTEDRRREFSLGVKYADQAIAADPKNPDCYMWHCANYGRECQTHSLAEQAKAVPVMLGDLDMILKTLGRTDYSAAWQALSEIYWHHPFKSNDEAIEYARKAVRTIPKGELRLCTYTNLAKMLQKRNYSAAKNSGMSDRDEATEILRNASAMYISSGSTSLSDKKDYDEIKSLLK